MTPKEKADKQSNKNTMKANELRLGNIIYDSFQVMAEVKKLNSEGSVVLSALNNDYSYESYSLDHTFGIQITREKLLEFGFIEHSSRILYTGINEDFKIGYDFGIVKKLLLVFKDGDLSVIHKMDVNYIHELQNIYFDFTRKELLINNKQQQYNE